MLEFLHEARSTDKLTGQYDVTLINDKFLKSEVAIRNYYFRDNAFYRHMELNDFQRLRKGIFEELKKSLDYYLRDLG